MPHATLALPRFEPLSVSVDYFTCTAKTGTRSLSMFYRMLGEIEKKQAAGQERRKWAANGYQGYSCDGVSIGRRVDGSIVRLSGFDAEYYWRSCHAQSDNASRIDLSVTAVSDHPEFPVAWAARGDFLRWRENGNRAIKYHYHDTGTDGNSLEVGSRSSDFFGRIYDKYRESAFAWPVGSWRWELELKNEQARQFAEELFARDDRRSHIVGQTMAFFSQRGIQVPFASAANQWRYKADRDEGRLARKLAWLREQVAPTCRELAEFVGEDEVLTTLGLTDRLSLTPKVSRETGDEVKRLWQQVTSTGAQSEDTSPPLSG